MTTDAITKINVISFKHGPFWFACCEIPTDNGVKFYYDNTPCIFMCPPVVLHTFGLSRDRVNKRILHKLEVYFAKN